MNLPNDKLTPYAVLMVAPSANDDVIRKAFYAISKECHPDVVAPTLATSERWAAAAAAYAAIKTEKRRERFIVAVTGRAGTCARCAGTGVCGWPKLRRCEQCEGTGRAKR